MEKATDTTVNVASCCVNRTHPTDAVDFADTVFRDQRKLIAQGQQIDACSHCWGQEAAGGYSIRQTMNQRLTYTEPNRVELLNLDYNVEPICNGQCIICGPNYSSAWLAEEQQYNNIKSLIRSVKTIRNNDPLNTVDLSSLQRVYFNGGEPLLTDEHCTVLERIPDLGQVDIAYNTNGSTLPNQRTQALWSRARSVAVNVSVDGVGSTFEYTRYPIKFDQVDEFMRSVQAINVDLSVSFTVGLHNLLSVKATELWAQQYTDNFYTQPVNGMLSVVNADPKLKQFFLEYMRDTTWGEPYINLINQQFSRVDHHWQTRLTELDQRRGLAWRQDLTELAQAYKIIGLSTVN